MGEICEGLYEELLTEHLQAKLERVDAERVHLVNVASDTNVDQHLVTAIRDAARIAISGHRKAEHKLALAQRVMDVLVNDPLLTRAELSLVPKILRQIFPLLPAELQGSRQSPRGSLLRSSLLTNAQGESILEHISSEFDSADRIDLLCSFIKLSGLDRIGKLVERHCQRGRSMRVLTTTYMRATDASAVHKLSQIGADIRVSYDESHTRLHAKSWVFHRNTAYSTAYVGSSNLSHAAQTDGLEWNVRVVQADQPDLVDEMAQVFETYWQDSDAFSPYDGSEDARVRLTRALSELERPGTARGYDLEPKPWQTPILRELADARSRGRHKNLIVAATGSGKTLIAAFDYRALREEGTADTLLYIAHRKEILVQARDAFRDVLRLPNFGELWVDGARPSDYRHVFASIQSLDAVLRDRDERLDRFQYVLVDEVHHAAAATYERLLARTECVELVGLTATPERTDGRAYAHHFPRPYIGNLRVWNAIPDVLVPFRYFKIDAPGVDLREAKWTGKYDDSEISERLITSADLWVRALIKALARYIARPDQIRALAFCVDKAHARVVADRMEKDASLKARVLVAETPASERASAKDDLIRGKIQVLCVVDLFNEGVDIPDVNTLFLMRPTESATVFLQQLGRGLRRTRHKDILTVFDMTGRQHESFRFDRHLRALLGMTPRELRDFVEHGTGRLPTGCVLQFEELAQRDLLESLRRCIPSQYREICRVMGEGAEREWSLPAFLEETEIDPLDLYRNKHSWTSLCADALGGPSPTDATEKDALERVQNLMEVNDLERIDAWTELLEGKRPTSERARRLSAMLMVTLYGRFAAADLDLMLELLESHGLLRAELRQYLPVLRARADALIEAPSLEEDVPLVLHGRYRDTEIAAAFATVTKEDGRYRNFYTGVEAVAMGRYDLLLVTLDKSASSHEHLRYLDYPLNERVFHWQSQANTRQDSPLGLRHTQPESQAVTPLLFVRERARDERRLTAAFRFLGAVSPQRVEGERPISIEWRLATPLRSEWVRSWRNVM